MKIINIITLGCSKNVVDSERLAQQLRYGGWQVRHGSSEAAQAVIINTCGFINAAKEEAINTILHYARQRRSGNIERLFVMGCLCERYADALRKEIPEVDEYFGVNSMAAILTKLNIVCRSNLLGERLISTPKHYAYLKIAEGCSRRCAFCAIPMIRGKYISTPLAALVDEAQMLAAQGVRELILVAQDLTNYGLDLYRNRRLPNLLAELSKIDGIEWIRLHYLYPDPFLLKLTNVMNVNSKICHYLDIPIQHISNKVLANMRRGYSQTSVVQMIAALRSSVPDIALRTTLMVGFPDESAEDFKELLKFVKDSEFDRLGVFTYSRENDTAAERCSDNVPDSVKQRRLHEVMTLQNKISLDKNRRKVGSRHLVLVDRQDGARWIARSQYDSPDIDGEVYISTAQTLVVGSFYDVEIISGNDYDLFGQL